ncbi:MAG: site-specific integrase [Rhodococcus sp.]|nr:site-specific integrase [Rhodococcus sp. (in: high G+C Gram-positive bacteria)]
MAYAKLQVQKEEERLDHIPRLTGSSGTLGNLVAQWLHHLESGDSRKGSLTSYRSRLATATKFFGSECPLVDIQPAHVQAYADELKAKRAPNTASSYYGTFVAMLKYGVDEGILARAPLPARSIRFGKGEAKRPHRLDDIETVMTKLSGPIAPLAELLYLTGLRIGEALALTADSLDGDFLKVEATRSRTLGPPKTRRSQRLVALSPRAKAILKKRIAQAKKDGETYLWPFQYAAYQKQLKNAKVGVTWHGFRHANVALRHAAGEDLRESSAQVGHANLDRTLDYGWHNPDSANAKKLDAARSGSGSKRRDRRHRQAQ